MLFLLLATYVATRLGPAHVVCGAGCLAALASAATRRQRVLVLLPPLGAAILLGMLDRRTPPSLGTRVADVTLEGWLDSRPRRSPGGRYQAVLVLQRAAGLPHGLRPRRVLLRGRQPLPAYGSRVRVTGRLRRPRPPANFGAWSEVAQMRSARVAAVLEVAAVETLPGRGGHAWRRVAIEPLREHLRHRLHEVLAPRPAGVLAALLVGIRDDVDRELVDRWRALGVSHVLAISGLHVGLVAWGLLLVVGSLHRRGAFGIWALGLIAYAGLGGLGPSVLRAVGMALATATAWNLGRPPRGLDVLALAGFVLLVGRPERLGDVAFQLSMGATLGILLWAPVWLTAVSKHAAARGARRALAWAGGAAWVSLAAQLGTLPIALAVFGALPWLALPANLVLVPLANLALALGWIGVLLLGVSEPAARALWLDAALALEAADRLACFVTEHVDPRWFPPTNTATTVAAAAVAAGALAAGVWGARRAPRRTAVALTLVALGGTWLAWSAHRGGGTSPWACEALDVGQGDAVLLSVGGTHWLTDAGNGRPYDAGARRIVPRLRRLGVRRLRGLMISHPHADHAGGALSILQLVTVDTLYLAHASSTATAYARLRESAPRVPVRWLAAGDRLGLAPGYHGEVLWPGRTDTLHSGANGQSLVVWAHGEDGPDLLLMGDLEADGEAALLARWGDWMRDRRARFLVLKVGHHGSATSSTPAWVHGVDPEVALISVGRWNRYGHPSARTLERLREAGSCVLRTDRGGAVRLEVHGLGLVVRRPEASAQVLQLGFEVD